MNKESYYLLYGKRHDVSGDTFPTHDHFTPSGVVLRHLVTIDEIDGKAFVQYTLDGEVISHWLLLNEWMPFVKKICKEHGLFYIKIKSTPVMAFVTDEWRAFDSDKELGDFLIASRTLVIHKSA